MSRSTQVVVVQISYFWMLFGLVNEDSVGMIGIQNPETRDLINFDGRAGKDYLILN